MTQIVRLACIGLVACFCLWSASSQTEGQDKDKPAEYLPKTLKLSTGGALGARQVTVECNGKELQYKVTNIATDKSTTKTVTPSDAQWKKFWSSMDDAKVWQWKAKYDNPDLLDGAYWILEIEHSDKKVKSVGKNSYPSDDDVAKPTQKAIPSKVFKRFQKALETLLGFELEL